MMMIELSYLLCDVEDDGVDCPIVLILGELYLTSRFEEPKNTNIKLRYSQLSWNEHNGVL